MRDGETPEGTARQPPRPRPPATEGRPRPWRLGGAGSTPAAAEWSVRPRRHRAPLHPSLLPCLHVPVAQPPASPAGLWAWKAHCVLLPRPPPQATVQPRLPCALDRCPPDTASTSLSTLACPKVQLPRALPEPAPLWSPVPPTTAPSSWALEPKPWRRSPPPCRHATRHREEAAVVHPPTG